MKVGDILIAIDPCKMRPGGENALTVGKRYKITNINNEYIEIIDDAKVNHSYNLEGEDSWQRFFTAKEGNVLRILNKIDDSSY